MSYDMLMAMAIEAEAEATILDAAQPTCSGAWYWQGISKVTSYEAATTLWARAEHLRDFADACRGT